MHETVQAALLGILQGLTEFLPISSSAHLILLPWFLGWKPMGILFDVVIHGGTLLAVLLYFRKDWYEFTTKLIMRLRSPLTWGQETRMVDAILVGTLPAIAVALLFRDVIEEVARTPMVTVVTLSLFGLLLLWADRRGKMKRRVADITILDGLLIGVAQSLALVPGVSRSGATITMALLLGLTRPEAARFSFLLAGPIIAMGAANGILEMITGSGEGALSASVIITGVFTSFLVGFLCIAFFLKFLQSRSYIPFVVYRILLAGVILGLALTR